MACGKKHNKGKKVSLPKRGQRAATNKKRKTRK